MAQELIEIGTANAKQGDTLFDAFTKVNNNFSELYSSKTAANVVIVNSLEDLPEAVGGVRTLVAETIYHIGAQVVTVDRFECESGAFVTSNNPFGPALVYTGTGVMFTGVDANFALSQIVISCPAAQAFDFTSNDGSHTFGLETSTIVQCQKAGVLNNMRSLNATNSAFLSITDGFTFTGSDWQALSIIRMRMVSASAACVAISLDDSLHQSVEINNLSVSGEAGTVGISGLVDSGNISTGYIAGVAQSEFVGGIVPLFGIAESDIRWAFIGNSGIMDSTVDANPYLTTSTTVTINTVGEYEKVNQGNWSFTTATRVTVTDDGDIINDLEGIIKIQITGSCTVEKTGGGSDLVTARLVYNNDPDDAQSVVTEVGTDNSAPTSIPLTGIFTLNPNDSVSIYVANQDSTSNVAVDYAKFALLRVL